MSALTRRTLFSGSAAVATIAAVPAVATVSPDAELIRLCDEHITNRRAYDASDSSLEHSGARGRPAMGALLSHLRRDQ